MDYKELLKDNLKKWKKNVTDLKKVEVSFGDPLSKEDLKELQEDFDCKIPKQLRKFYRQCDGLEITYELKDGTSGSFELFSAEMMLESPSMVWEENGEEILEGESGSVEFEDEITEQAEELLEEDEDKFNEMFRVLWSHEGDSDEICILLETQKKGSIFVNSDWDYLDLEIDFNEFFEERVCMAYDPHLLEE